METSSSSISYSEKKDGLRVGLRFVRRNFVPVVFFSALVTIPCLWHRHIEAGDLGSHVYNAWLAQLIRHGQAPGLYLARQWNNVLFDVTLLHVANVTGFAAAEKIVVALFALIFFWGVFALVTAIAGQPPWLLTSAIGMLTYGYSFNMGFLNYHVSIGLACFCIALARHDLRRNWVSGLVVLALAYVAHPIGFLWAVATIVYMALFHRVHRAMAMALPFLPAVLVLLLRAYLHTRPDMQVDWTRSMPIYEANGADQLMIYGDNYATVALIAVIFGAICFAVGAVGSYRHSKAPAGYQLPTPRWRRFGNALVLPLQLYFVAFVVTALLPENLRLSMYAAWVGLLVSRLTTISAICGLCVLGCVKPWKGAALGFSILAAAYFALLYQDTGALNRMERNAEAVLWTVPVGTRVVPTIFADPDWRVEFIGHLTDRACVHRCFVYSNYEPSSRQFRVRVAPAGSWMVTNSSDAAEDLQGGNYEIDEGDLPLKQLYQCDPHDWTKLCLRDLAVGENTGTLARHPRP